MEVNEEYREFSLEKFHTICNNLENAKGYESQDASLFSLMLYLKPSFLLDNSDEWEKGYNILLKHIRSRDIPNMIRRTAISYLGFVFDNTQDIEINGKVTEVSQRELMRGSNLYQNGIETLKDVRHSTNRFINLSSKDVLERENLI
jgi:hypothetical protein